MADQIIEEDLDDVSIVRALEEDIIFGRLAPGARLTEDSLLYQCKNFRENLKFKYLYKLVDASSAAMAETVLARFQAFGADTTTALEQIHQQRAHKDEAEKAIGAMQSRASEVRDKLTRLQEEIDSL